MTDPRETLARIRAQADAATDGPWEVDPFTWKPGHPTPSSEWLGIEATGPVEGEVARIRLNDDEDRANAEFITHARTDVPWLLEQVELRDKALDAVRALHFERAELACGNPTHTVPDLMCPDCLTVCDDCGVPWPCPTVEAITAVLEGEPHD